VAYITAQFAGETRTPRTITIDANIIENLFIFLSSFHHSRVKFTFPGAFPKRNSFFIVPNFVPVMIEMLPIQANCIQL
jgi:hypothetical protein